MLKGDDGITLERVIPTEGSKEKYCFDEKQTINFLEFMRHKAHFGKIAKDLFYATAGITSYGTRAVEFSIVKLTSFDEKYSTISIFDTKKKFKKKFQTTEVFRKLIKNLISKRRIEINILNRKTPPHLNISDSIKSLFSRTFKISRIPLET